MERSIADVARLTGITSRTLRHYAQIGLLSPSRTGHGGMRYYDEDGLLRLQRILLLRELGLSLTAIADVLAGTEDATDALETHLELLEREQDRLRRQIASVRRTLGRREGGETVMAEEMFDGFDHTRYRDEVEDRWGTQAYASADRAWRSMSEAERAEFGQRGAHLNADWCEAAASGVPADSERAQQLAARHVQWLAAAPGASGAPANGYVLGLADMYVDDERFAANYGGRDGATFVRDALRAYVGDRG